MTRTGLLKLQIKFKIKTKGKVVSTNEQLRFELLTIYIKQHNDTIRTTIRD
jgi:hypothetical protein